MKFDLITFGETLIRLSPPGPRSIEQATSLDMYPAGSELNIAVAASRMGLRVSYVSKLADNPLGRFIASKCREHQVDTTWVRYSSDRQGLYFFENGSPPRPGIAYYDRKNSAFSRVQPDDFPWEEIMSETRLFLTTGINPPLSPSADQVTREALKAARKCGAKTAFDLNYRSKLWDIPTAARVLREYLADINILFTSAGDAASLLGYSRAPNDQLALRIAEDYGLETVCLIYSPENSSSLWRVVCAHQGKTYAANQEGQLITVDRLGAGDAFAGGFLTGFLEEGPELGVKMGNAMLTLKNTFLGDLTYATREMVNSFIDGEHGMVKR